MELQELLISLDEEGDRGQVTAPTESDEIASVTAPSPAKAPEEAGLDIAGEPPLQAGSSLRHNEVATVVQGPWRASRGANAGVGPARPERGGDDARAQRVARLEQTFDQFGKMVERLAARSRGTRPPPS